MADIELAATSTFHSDGYPAVASFVARDPDHETFVFRRFKILTARNLLHMQSELLELEQRQIDFDTEAAKSGDRVLRRSMRRWEDFEANAQVREQERERMELASVIESKLDKYHKALLLQSQIARLEHPPERVLSGYREMLLGVQGDDPKVGGKAMHLLDDVGDLAILMPPKEGDVLSLLLRKRWILKTRRPDTKSHLPTRGFFEERLLTTLVNVCSTAIAAMLLIGSILALYFVKSPDARLGIVLGFIVLFAIGLSLTTHASREAIFAATAAYAAVLIVYISGNVNKT